MALKNRTDLVNEALANLGIIQQTDSSATYTRAQLGTEALSRLGINYQADTSATRTRADWVTETLQLLGVVRGPVDESNTSTRASLVAAAMANLGAAFNADASGTHTRAELVNNVAYILGPGAVGQTLSADDYNAIDIRVESVFADLNARAIATVSNPAAIPGAWFDGLSIILANACKQQYGVTGDQATRLQSEALAAERNLKIITRSSLVDGEVDSVVGDLLARRVTIVALPVVDVQTQFLGPLSVILADSVKGYFDVPADLSSRLAADAQQAERDLKVTARGPIVDEILPSLLGELNARMVATIADIEAIPGAWFPSLADIAAEHCKGEFDITPERSQQIAARAAAAETKLKRLNRAAMVDADILAIVGDLNARGVATISNVDAIPGAWFHSIADIVASQVAVKVEADPAVAQRVAAQSVVAERALKNLTRTYIIDRNIDPILADLAARDIIYLVDVTAIPDEWFLHIAAIVADRCKGKGFDLDPGTISRVTLDGRQAVLDLRELTRGRPAYLVQQSTYF